MRTKTGQAQVNKVRRGYGSNSTFGKVKFITRLNIRPNIINQSALLNTLQMGLNNVRLGLEACSLNQLENSKFNGVVSKGKNTRFESDKIQTRSNFHYAGCSNTQDVSNSLQSRCNNTQTGMNNHYTGYNKTPTGSNKTYKT